MYIYAYIPHIYIYIYIYICLWKTMQSHFSTTLNLKSKLRYCEAKLRAWMFNFVYSVGYGQRTEE